jgi:lipopolysaccharide heptosyltransferase I
MTSDPSQSLYPMSSHRRILITRLSAHGDVMHTLPLLTALKKADPALWVGWLVEHSAAGLLENHPLIDVLHVSDRKRWMKALLKPRLWKTTLGEFRAFLSELKQQQYDASCDVQGLLKSAIWPWLAHIPVRFGFRKTREYADWFYTNTLPPMNLEDANTHAINRYLDFARVLGYPAAWPPRFSIPVIQALNLSSFPDHAEDENTDPVQRLKHWHTKGVPVVALAPFTRWPSKQWPLDYWKTLIARLLNKTETLGLVLLGGAENRPAIQDLLTQLRHTHTEIPASKITTHLCNLTGKTSWSDLYRVFGATTIVVGLDSAPLHIANAVGTPQLIGLYGPTAPGRTGPVGEQCMVLNTHLSCQPCFSRECPIKTHDCMAQLSPEQVYAAVCAKLDKTESSNP